MRQKVSFVKVLQRFLKFKKEKRLLGAVPMWVTYIVRFLNPYFFKHWIIWSIRRSWCYCPKLFKKNCLRLPKNIMHCFDSKGSARTTYFLKFVWTAELHWREDLLIGIVLVRCGLNMELLGVLGRRAN